MVFGKRYEDIVKEMIKSKKWDKVSVEKVVRYITESPDFMLRNNVSLYLQVALEEEERLDLVFRLTPKVAKELKRKERAQVLKALIEDGTLRTKRGIGEMVYDSFGWAIDKTIQDNREDEDFVSLLTETLTDVGNSLDEGGFIMVKVDLEKGKIHKVNHFTKEDVKDELVSLDIIKENGISYAK